MPVCQASVVIPEALDLKEWRGCLVSLGKKVNKSEVRQGLLCWGCELGHSQTQAAVPGVPTAGWRLTSHTCQPEASGTSEIN